jgi:hypothetical protein
VGDFFALDTTEANFLVDSFQRAYHSSVAVQSESSVSTSSSPIPSPPSLIVRRYPPVATGHDCRSAFRPQNAPLEMVSTTAFIATSLQTIDTTAYTLLDLAGFDGTLLVSILVRKSRQTQLQKSSKMAEHPPPEQLRAFVYFYCR